MICSICKSEEGALKHCSKCGNRLTERTSIGVRLSTSKQGVVIEGKALSKSEVKALSNALRDYLHGPEFHGCGCSKLFHDQGCEFLRFG